MSAIEHAGEADGSAPARGRWASLALVLALAWVAVVRLPLIANAPAHLDSDLAVDGLTLLDAVRGHWRWHFPGTPHMGIVPLLLAWPGAAIVGASPQTLVVGGVIAYESLLLATFVLARGAFGPRVAAWGLVPLAFASTGTVWLSGRLTGGHLLTATWSAVAFALLHGWLARGGLGRAVALGTFCGLGLYNDRLFLFTLLAVLPIAVLTPLFARSGRRLLPIAAMATSFAVGYLPHEIGRRIDPHDAYREQFDPILSPQVLNEHAHLLAFDCLPRLIAGHRLPGLQAEPSPAAVGSRPSPPDRRTGDDLDLATTTLALTLFAVAMVVLAIGPRAGRNLPETAIRWGMLATSASLVAAFVLNRNIFNSDNYRYLVPLLVPWAIGFGLAADRLARGRSSAVMVGALALIFAGLMTIDTARWYARFGWVGEAGRRVRREAALDWLADHPEVSHVFGGYWDVYRLAFLSRGRVVGVPYPIYPNRFPGWSRGLGAGRGRLALIRPGPRWRDFLRASWRDEGRDPGELARLAIVTWP